MDEGKIMRASGSRQQGSRAVISSHLIFYLNSVFVSSSISLSCLPVFPLSTCLFPLLPSEFPRECLFVSLVFSPHPHLSPLPRLAMSSQRYQRVCLPVAIPPTSPQSVDTAG